MIWAWAGLQVGCLCSWLLQGGPWYQRFLLVSTLGNGVVALLLDWPRGITSAVFAALCAWLWWRDSRPRRRKAAQLLGNKGRAVIAAMVRAMRPVVPVPVHGKVVR
jgi:membrane protein implicated in regulation of membrane protease activity